MVMLPIVSFECVLVIKPKISHVKKMFSIILDTKHAVVTPLSVLEWSTGRTATVGTNRGTFGCKTYAHV